MVQVPPQHLRCRPRHPCSRARSAARVVEHLGQRLRRRASSQHWTPWIIKVASCRTTPRIMTIMPCSGGVGPVDTRLNYTVTLVPRLSFVPRCRNLPETAQYGSLFRSHTTLVVYAR